MAIKKYIIATFFLFTFTACTKEFLDVDNTQSVFREVYVKDLNSMEEYLRGIYHRLSRSFEAGEHEVTYADLAADNLRPVSATSAPATFPIYNWVQNSIDFNMTGFWQNAYQTIRMCSFVIDETGQYKEDNPAKANNMIGQAKAIRAMIHFRLVNVFAQPYTFTSDASHPGVPYITTADITKSYIRQNVAQVYDAIINDLNSALELLPSTIDDTRYMNLRAAKALLARVYLFKEDFINSNKLAKEISNDIPLMTIASGYPVDIFKFKTPATTEVLFQISPGSSNLLGRYVIGAPIRYIATTDIANILKENPSDVRKNWVKDSVISGNSVRLVKKFPMGAAGNVSPAPPANASYYPVLFRSSEMFLTVAEASAKTNDETTARTYLNAIRKRADPTIADVTATGAALLDSIYKERRKELSFEGIRLFDLQRWKKGVNRTDVVGGSPMSLSYPSNKAISPIPEREIRLVGMAQNPEY